MMRILVPLDGSLAAEQALPTAISLARLHHASLDLVMVTERKLGDGLENWPWALSTSRNHAEYVAQRANQIMEQANVAVDHVAGEGRAADMICRQARDRGADLVVMTTRAQSGFARIIGGSVADAVVRRANRPVLLLREATVSQRTRRRAVRFERVLVAVDGSGDSMKALDAAIALADRGVTELHLIELVAPALVAPLRAVRHIARVDREVTQNRVAAADARLCALAEDVAERSGCDVFPHVTVHGDPAQAILRVARDFNASVIAMGTHGRGASRLFVGSIAERVLRDERFPLLIVHRADGADVGNRLAPTEESCALTPNP